MMGFMLKIKLLFYGGKKQTLQKLSAFVLICKMKLD